MPDCTRFARKDKDSVIAVLGIIIGFTRFICRRNSSLVTGGVDIVKIAGIGFVFQL
jgi:hypothetical protein